MRARLLSNARVLLMSCMAACCFAPDAAAEQFLVTVMRSSNPLEVRELLGSKRPPAATGPVGLRRDFRTSGYGQRHHSQWQVIVSEGQAAFLATGSVTPQLQVPLIELRRRGAVPHARLVEHEDVQGFDVQARRHGREVEVELHQFTGRNGPDSMSGHPAPGLRTVLRGRPGQWLDAGGNLLPESESPATRRYGLWHSDPQRFRLLVRIDPLD